MINAWTIYFASAAVLLVILYFLSRKWLSVALRVQLLLIMSLLLLTPMGVTDTNALAPAWLIVVFEYAFGSEQVAHKALKPLAVVFTLYLLVMAFALGIRRRIKIKQNNAT